jgi:TatD DNase family protein
MSEDYPPDPDPDAFYSVGLHPWKLAETDISTALKTVQISTENCQVLAIGETGLDKQIEVPMGLQLSVFEVQVELAEIIGLPVIVHMVKTAQELIAFYKTHKPSVPLIIHGFRGSTQLAEDLIQTGYYLSFGGALLESEKIKTSFKSLPLDQLFLETDESELGIREIYAAAAQIRAMEMQALLGHMSEKTNTLFER